MSAVPVLRPYQVSAIEELRRRLKAGSKKICLVAPTGSGKTVMGADIIRSAIAKGSRTLFVAHRKELIDQTYSKLEAFGVLAGIIMADDPRADDYHPTQVASIQTLARRMDRLPEARLVIIDECHHALSETWSKLIARYSDAIVVGLTATPWRSDRKGLGDIFEDLVLAATPRELMDQGYLVGYQAFAYDSPDLHSVAVTAGEWNQKDLGIACNTAVLVGSVVREYVEHTPGKRAILFPVNIAHSLRLVEDFNAQGVRAEHIDFKTPKDVRAQAIANLASGATMVLSSVGVLTEGFDSPAAEVCILARPTRSFTLHLQMIGRVLRPSAATGKACAVIHCHSGNILRHGLPDDFNDYTLAPTPDRVIRKFTCPACKEIFGSLTKDGRCPKCNEVLAEVGGPAAARKAKTQVDGERIDVDEIRRRREAAGLENDMSDEDLRRAKRATREEKAAEYLRLVDVQVRKGFKVGFVAHQFRAVFSHWPKFTDEELAGARAAEKPFARRRRAYSKPVVSSAP